MSKALLNFICSIWPCQGQLSKDFQSCHQEQVKSGCLSVCALSQAFSSLWMSPSLQNWTPSISASTFISLGSTSSNLLRCTVALFGSVMQFGRPLTIANSINMWPFLGTSWSTGNCTETWENPFFTVWLTAHGKMVPWEVVLSPSLQIRETPLDTTLSSLFQLTLLWAGRLN